MQKCKTLSLRILIGYEFIARLRSHLILTDSVLIFVDLYKLVEFERIWN